jgi:hypothetical protein
MFYITCGPTTERERERERALAVIAINVIKAGI